MQFQEKKKKRKSCSLFSYVSTQWLESKAFKNMQEKYMARGTTIKSLISSTEVLICVED